MDNERVCYGAMILKGCNSKTFQELPCGYYKDAQTVFLNGVKLSHLDAPSFEILTWGFSKDKYKVYCDQLEIIGADPITFEVLGRKHSKDDKNIFYMTQLIDCDYASFAANSELDYMSGDNKYKHGIRMEK